MNNNKTLLLLIKDDINILKSCIILFYNVVYADYFQRS